MRWRNVRLEQTAVVLTEHKTAKKTGRPRVIPLVPPVVKLLAWMRSHRQASVVGLVERFLMDAGGVLKAPELARKMKPYGASDHAVARARAALGVEKHLVLCRPKGAPRNSDCEDLRDVVEEMMVRSFRAIEIYKRLQKDYGYEGSYDSVKRYARRLTDEVQSSRGRPSELAPRSYYEYRLPEDHVPLPDPTLNDFVFVNALGNRFCKNSLSLRMQRLRVRAGLPKHVTLYELRHRFAFQGIRHGVNLKLLSLALGHASTAMTEHYVYDAGLGVDVQQAVMQIAYGPGVLPVEKREPPPRPVEVVRLPPVEEIPAVAEHLPNRANSELARPQVPLGDPPQNGSKVETMLAQLLKRLPAEPSKRNTVSLIPEKLRPAEQESWDAYQWALGQDATLTTAKDGEVFLWLQSRPDCPCKLPPLVDTFRRYLGKARLFLDQRKRVLRPRVPAPIPEESDQ